MLGGGTSAMATPDSPDAFWPGPILLDVSRTLSRRHLNVPTGIDRVEAAYYARLRPGRPWGFARIAGGFVLLESDGLARLLGPTATVADAALDLRGMLPRRPLAVRRAESLARRLARGRSREGGLAAMLRRHLPPGALALNVGHSNLSDQVMSALKAAGAQRVVMLHDTIPLDHPDLAAPGMPRRFAARLAAAGKADLVLTNSQHSAKQVTTWMARLGASPPRCHVVPLGIEVPDLGWSPAARPHFVLLGTVEPRKGHDHLLDIWSGWGDDAPTLHVIGRMGWADRPLRRRLSNPPARFVLHGALADAAARRLLATARALLLPSRAEGYGLPLAEARAMGLPAIVSDLPALRETGGDWPVYLPPQDQPAWRRAIECRAAAPITRLTPNQGCPPMVWDQHFVKLQRILSEFRKV